MIDIGKSPVPSKQQLPELRVISGSPAIKGKGIINPSLALKAQPAAARGWKSGGGKINKYQASLSIYFKRFSEQGRTRNEEALDHRWWSQNQRQPRRGIFRMA